MFAAILAPNLDIPPSCQIDLSSVGPSPHLKDCICLIKAEDVFDPNCNTRCATVPIVPESE